MIMFFIIKNNYPIKYFPTIANIILSEKIEGQNINFK